MTDQRCDFNRSTQHLDSHYREEDVENEVSDEDLLHRDWQGDDGGLLNCAAVRDSMPMSITAGRTGNTLR